MKPLKHVEGGRLNANISRFNTCSPSFRLQDAYNRTSVTKVLFMLGIWLFMIAILVIVHTQLLVALKSLLIGKRNLQHFHIRMPCNQWRQGCERSRSGGRQKNVSIGLEHVAKGRREDEANGRRTSEAEKVACALVVHNVAVVVAVVLLEVLVTIAIAPMTTIDCLMAALEKKMAGSGNSGALSDVQSAGSVTKHLCHGQASDRLRRM
eukprot:6194652-Pleurochrysis_carterae.AAC.1